jgi:hypothetical protein
MMELELELGLQGREEEEEALLLQLLLLHRLAQS